MKSHRQLLELAQQHDVPTTTRRFLEVRDDPDSPERTVFVDLPRARDDIVEDLRRKGVLPSR